MPTNQLLVVSALFTTVGLAGCVPTYEYHRATNYSFDFVATGPSPASEVNASPTTQSSLRSAKTVAFVPGDGCISNNRISNTCLGLISALERETSKTRSVISWEVAEQSSSVEVFFIITSVDDQTYDDNWRIANSTYSASNDRVGGQVQVTADTSARCAAIAQNWVSARTSSPSISLAVTMKAIDAHSGSILWNYDSKTPKTTAGDAHVNMNYYLPEGSNKETRKKKYNALQVFSMLLAPVAYGTGLAGGFLLVDANVFDTSYGPGVALLIGGAAISAGAFVMLAIGNNRSGAREINARTAYVDTEICNGRETRVNGEALEVEYFSDDEVYMNAASDFAAALAGV